MCPPPPSLRFLSFFLSFLPPRPPDHRLKNTQAVAGPVRPPMPLPLLRPAPVRALRVRFRIDFPPRPRPVPVRFPLRTPVDPRPLEPDDGGDDRPGIGADGRASPPVQPRGGRGRECGGRARRRRGGEGRAASTSGREEVREVQRQLQAGEGAPRQRHREVRRQDGPLLPVGGERRRDHESQGEESNGSFSEPCRERASSMFLLASFLLFHYILYICMYYIICI